LKRPRNRPPAGITRFLGFIAAVLERSKEWEVVLFFKKLKKKFFLIFFIEGSYYAVCGMVIGNFLRKRHPEGIMAVLLRIHSCSSETKSRFSVS